VRSTTRSPTPAARAVAAAARPRAMGGGPKDRLPLLRPHLRVTFRDPHRKVAPSGPRRDAGDAFGFADHAGRAGVMAVGGAGLAGLGRDGRSRPAARAGERSGQAAQIESTEVFDLDRLQRIDIHATARCAPRWDRSTGAPLRLAEAIVSGESGRTLGQDDKQASRLGCPRRLLQRGPEPRGRACECSFCATSSNGASAASTAGNASEQQPPSLYGPQFVRAAASRALHVEGADQRRATRHSVSGQDGTRTGEVDGVCDGVEDGGERRHEASGTERSVV
jgi:hypothetical protein